MRNALRLTGFLLVMSLAQPIVGQEPVPPPVSTEIHFPQVVTPTPPPPPPVGSVPILPTDVMYIISSPQQFFVRASPAPLVTVRYVTGPMMIHGKFVEDPNKSQTREYKEKFLVMVLASGISAGRVDLIVIPAGVTKDADILVRQIDVLGPAPKPPDPPSPNPKPDGKLGLIRSSREGLAKVPAASAGKAAALAAGHRELAKDLKDNPTKYPTEKFALADAVLTAKRAKNKAAVGTDQSNWLVWSQAVDPIVQIAYNAGVLNTPGDWADALIEIAQGLEGG